MDAEFTVEAATVVRVAPAGFTAPYVLAAVRSDSGLSAGRIEADPETPPAPGLRLRWLREENGAQVYAIAGR